MLAPSPSGRNRDPRRSHYTRTREKVRGHPPRAERRILIEFAEQAARFTFSRGSFGRDRVCYLMCSLLFKKMEKVDYAVRRGLSVGAQFTHHLPATVTTLPYRRWRIHMPSCMLPGSAPTAAETAGHVYNECLLLTSSSLLLLQLLHTPVLNLPVSSTVQTLIVFTLTFLSIQTASKNGIFTPSPDFFPHHE